MVECVWNLKSLISSNRENTLFLVSWFFVVKILQVLSYRISCRHKHLYNAYNSLKQTGKNREWRIDNSKKKKNTCNCINNWHCNIPTSIWRIFSIACFLSKHNTVPNWNDALEKTHSSNSDINHNLSFCHPRYNSENLWSFWWELNFLLKPPSKFLWKAKAKFWN